MSNITQDIDIEKIDISIELLKQYVKDTRMEPVFSALESLKEDPNNESILIKLTEALDSIGILKGAVLAYAPYISILVSYNLFEDMD